MRRLGGLAAFRENEESDQLNSWTVRRIIDVGSRLASEGCWTGEDRLLLA